MPNKKIFIDMLFSLLINVGPLLSYSTCVHLKSPFHIIISLIDDIHAYFKMFTDAKKKFTSVGRFP
jgi:hypothetical protein